MNFFIKNIRDKKKREIYRHILKKYFYIKKIIYAVGKYLQRVVYPRETPAHKIIQDKRKNSYDYERIY